MKGIEVRQLFWVVAGILFVGIIIFVGVTMTGRLAEIAVIRCEPAGESAVEFDWYGISPGRHRDPTVVCSEIRVCRGVVRPDDCINKSTHTCQESFGTTYKADIVDPKRALEILGRNPNALCSHAKMCAGGDVCVDARKELCCPDANAVVVGKQCCECKGKNPGYDAARGGRGTFCGWEWGTPRRCAWRPDLPRVAGEHPSDPCLDSAKHKCCALPARPMGGYCCEP